MSIVLDNPELEAAAAQLAGKNGTDVQQVATSALKKYLDSYALASKDRDAAGSRISVAKIMEIGKRCAELPVVDGSFNQESLYDENGLPDGPFTDGR